MENLALFVLMALASLAIVLNLVATYIISNTFFVVKNRKRNQIIFVWILPIIGAILAIYLNLEDYFATKHGKQVGNNPNITEEQAVHYGSAANHNKFR